MTHNPLAVKRPGSPTPCRGSAGTVRIVAWQQALVTQLTSVLAPSKGASLIQHLCAGHLATVTLCWAQKFLSKQGHCIQMFQATQRERQGHSSTVENTWALNPRPASYHLWEVAGHIGSVGLGFSFFKMG